MTAATAVLQLFAARFQMVAVPIQLATRTLTRDKQESDSHFLARVLTMQRWQAGDRLELTAKENRIVSAKVAHRVDNTDAGVEVPTPAVALVIFRLARRFGYGTAQFTFRGGSLIHDHLTVQFRHSAGESADSFSKHLWESYYAGLYPSYSPQQWQLTTELRTDEQDRHTTALVFSLI